MLTGAHKGAVGTRHLLQIARHLFNWAIQEGYAAGTPFKLNPMTRTPLINIKTTKGRSRRPEEGEAERILDVGRRLHPGFVTAMIETGLSARRATDAPVVRSAWR